MAAGRAATAAERVTHRLLAEKYAETVRQMMLARRRSQSVEPGEPGAQAA